MSYQTILVDTKDRVATITLNRPQKKNAMNPQLHKDVADALENLRYDDGVGAVVITGQGDSFCAGMDLKEFFMDLRDKPAEFDRVLRLCIEWRGRTLRYYPKPTICMINGWCFGGAFSIVEGTDLAFASEDATFGLSEINFKHFPGGAVSKSLANLLRPRDALFYAMTGRQFDGKEAEKIGFINKAVPSAKLKEVTYEIARELADKDAVAVRATKEAYRFSLEMSWEASMAMTAAVGKAITLDQGDSWRNEGIGDFIKGKYKPGMGGHEKAKG